MYIKCLVIDRVIDKNMLFLVNGEEVSSMAVLDELTVGNLNVFKYF